MGAGSYYYQLFFSALFLLATGCARPVLQVGSESGGLSQFSQSSCAVLDPATQQSVCAHILPESKIPVKKMSSFRFYFTDANGYYLDQPFHKVQLILWMPSMGHGSSPAKAESIGSGQYMASSVFFIMSGVWELRFKITPSENQEAVVTSLPILIR